MEHKVNKRNIRDRLLSLFIVLGMLTGLFTGLATTKQAEAADNLKRTIKLGGDDFIEYDPRFETITYKRIHPLAHSSIRYYTHDFVLSINPVDSEGEEYLGDAVDIDEFRLNPESVKTVKQLRIPLQFDPDNPGESLSERDARAIGETTGYYWWDDIDARKDIVTTTYVFDANIIYDFLDACGASTTDKVYIHHVFAMKWPGHDGDSICTLPKHEPYWQLKDKNGHLGIVDSVTWSDKSSVYKAMKNCLNIRVPLYREVPVMINYYDVETGAIVGRSKSSSALTMLDGSVDQFTRKDPFTIADLSGTIEFDGVDYSLVTDSKDYETRRPFVIFSAVTTMPVNTASTYDAHYNLAADVSAYYSSEWIDLKDSMGFSKLAWYRYNCTYDGLRRQVSFRTKILYSRTNVLGVYVPVKKTGADIYVNFYNKDTGKGFSSISAVQLEGADVNATNTLRQFEVPESLANEYELAMDGAFDVHGTDANKVKKYSDAKSMSTKKEGAYAPLAKKYTIKEAIAADNTYCIWIPLQKKTPEREIWTKK